MSTPTPAAQAGAAFLLVLVIAASLSGSAVLSQLQPANRNAEPQQSQLALMQAKQALLGYAASYPDRVNSKFGPGYLPCPAIKSNGVSGPACAADSGSTLGLFPWHTLRINELRDGSGAALWYLIDENYRYNPKQIPLNVDTSPGLSLHGRAVAAVVIAPGAAYNNQLRLNSNKPRARNFLEIVSASADLASLQLPQTAPSNSNDYWIAITADELAAAMQTRALGEMAEVLQHYKRTYGNYPLLRERAQPTALARHQRGFVFAHHFDGENKTSFSTTLNIEWNLSGTQDQLNDAFGLIPASCLQSSSCLGSNPLSTQALCHWHTPNPLVAPRFVFDCKVELSQSIDDVMLAYQINFELTALPSKFAVAKAGMNHPRQRAARWRLPHDLGANASAHVHIRITASDSRGRRARFVQKLKRSSTGSFRLSGVDYGLDVNNGELSAWFVQNQWPQLIYVAWADSGCQHHGRCLQLQDEVSQTPLHAILVGAGVPLSGSPLRTPTAPLSAWFESFANHNSRLFTERPPDAMHNDRLWVVEAAQ